MRKKTVLVPTKNTMNSTELPRVPVTLPAAPWETAAVTNLHVEPEPPTRPTMKLPNIEPLFDRSRAW